LQPVTEPSKFGTPDLLEKQLIFEIFSTIFQETHQSQWKNLRKMYGRGESIFTTAIQSLMPSTGLQKLLSGCPGQVAFRAGEVILHSQLPIRQGHREVVFQ